MTRRQAAFIIVVNAMISLLISIVVVLTLGKGRVTPPPATSLPTPTVQPLGVETPAPQPSPTRPSKYIVKEGDTLWQIAARFGVSLDALMRVNGISDPRFIQPGQELIIPSEELPLPTPTPTVPYEPPTPVFTPIGHPPPTPTPTIPPAMLGREGIYIESVINPGEPQREAIIIRNATGKVKNLGGWELVADGQYRYIFPDFLLWPQGVVSLYTGEGENNPGELFWGLEQPILHVVQELVLYDRTGEAVSTYRLR